MSRPRAVRDILIAGAPVIVAAAVGNIVGIGTLAGGAIINLGYVLMIIVGGLILKRQSSSWSEIGLRRPPSWPKTAVFGVGAFISAVVVFLAMQTVVVGLLTSLGMELPEIDQSRFGELEGNVSLLLLMVILSWTTIAFGEEMLYRAFIITRVVNSAAMRHWPAILISALIFGLAHFSEGSLGILSNGAFGVLFGWIFIRTGRNLWITVIGHALLNTLRFSLLYAGLG